MSTIPFATNFYAQGDPPPRADALDGDAHADVVIVGAGIVGLSCAYTLRQEGLDVAVVESEHVGHGSSGRHLGHVTPHMFVMGRKEPQLLSAWAQDSLDHTEKMLTDEGIDCDFERVPYWMPAIAESDEKPLRTYVEYFAQFLGLPARVVEAGEFDLVTYKTYGAMVLEDQGRLDPYRMVRGMRETLLKMGVRLYEGTPVESIEAGSPVVVKTPGGTLRAPKAVLAINAFSGRFPFLQNYVSSAHTYAIATRPLDEKTARTVGPTASEDIMIFDYGEGGSHYYQRLRRDGRLIFGGGAATPAPAPGRMAPDQNDEAFRRVHTEMIRRYPALEDAPIEVGWGGSVAPTNSGRPILAEIPGQENLILAIVGNGNGVGLGATAGRLVRGLVLGKDKLDGPTRAFLEFCRLRS